MKKNILCFLAVAVLTSACDEMQEVQTVGEARPAPVSEGLLRTCIRGNRIVVTAEYANYSVVPPVLCAKVDEEITVQFIGNKPAGTIILSAKPWIEGAEWLYAENPGGRGVQEAKFTIDKNAAPPGVRVNYPYNVTFVGELVIDPMMSID